MSIVMYHLLKKHTPAACLLLSTTLRLKLTPEMEAPKSQTEAVQPCPGDACMEYLIYSSHADLH